MNRRIEGLDFARAMALLGMIIVNFNLAMDVSHGNPELRWLISLLEGRASALFVVLAGVGISLMHQRNLQMDHTLNAFYHVAVSRSYLIKRGVILVVIGLLFSTIWPADILHFYGFYFFIAAVSLGLNHRQLLAGAIFICLSFVLLIAMLDYDRNWNWETLSYHHFWTMQGMWRHIFFNGFHPVIPWSAFILVGMWLGRQSLTNKAKRRKLLIGSLLICLTTELFSRLLIQIVGTDNPVSATLLSTAAIPPLPQYMLAAGSLAVLLIILCIEVAERYANSRIIFSCKCAGQLSLTLYIAHVVVGMGLLEMLNLMVQQSVEISLFSALLFFTCALAFSRLWLAHYPYGPLEWLIRKL